MMLLASPWDRRHRRSSRPVCLYQPLWGSWGGGAQRRVVAVAVAVAVAADAAVVAATQRKKKTLKSPWGGKGGERPCWHPPQVPSTFCGGACAQGGSLLSAAAPTMGVAASLICAPTFWRLPPSVGVTTPRGSARGNGRFHLFTCLSACDGRGSGGVAGGDPPAAK